MPRRLSALPGSRLRQGPRRMEPDGALLQLHARAQHSRLRGLCGRHRTGHCPSPIRSCNRPAVDMARSGGILAPYRATARNCPPHAYRSSLREYLLSLDRQSREYRVESSRKKYFASRLGRNSFIDSVVPSLKRGGSRSSRTLGTGCDGRGSVRRAGQMARGRMMLTRTAKSCGPGAPTLALSLRKRFRERRWQKSPVTGEITKETVKTIVQGMPVDAVYLWLLTRVLFLLHTRPRVQRASGIPCALLFEGHKVSHYSGAMRRENASACLNPRRHREDQRAASKHSLHVVPGKRAPRVRPGIHNRRRILLS